MAHPTTDTLTKEQFISLTTFRKDGTGVPTAVWFGTESDKLYVYTGGTSGKVKRIRRTPRVTVAACDRRGKVTGPVYEATARILPQSDGPRIDRLLNAKYGLQKRLFTAAQEVVRFVQRRPKAESIAYLEITPA